MKKLIVAVMIVLFTVTGANAEFIFDLYGGGTKTQGADINQTTKAGLHIGNGSNTCLNASVDLNGKNEDSFSNQGTYGLRVGYYFESLPWLGLALDVSKVRAMGDFSSFDSTPISALFMLRLPVMPTAAAPKGALQPYIMAGPSYVITDASANFGNRLVNKAVNDGLYNTVKDASVTYPAPNTVHATVNFQDDAGFPFASNGTSKELGFDARAGVAYQFAKNVSAFIEYRYLYHKVKAGGDIVSLGYGDEYIQAGLNARTDMDTTLHTHAIQGGIGFRF